MSEPLQQDRTGAQPPASTSQPAKNLGLLRSVKRRVMAVRGYGTFLTGLLASYWYDIRRYHRAASKGIEAVSAGKPRHMELRSWIAADAHKIEKGLALREPRPGFGKPVVKRLLEQVERYHAEFGPDHITEMAINVLGAYDTFNEEHHVGDASLRQRLEFLSRPLGDCHDRERGGLLPIERDAILARSQRPDLEDFFHSRHSIRDFADTPVSADTIASAIALAQRTPSVCNRQSWKAHVYLERDAAQRVLACQQGNRGFGDSAGGVIVVTSDLRTFFSYGERNQGFVDGGMFAMSLVYGLHAQGLGTCCLNWCAELSAERQLRAVADIPEHEVVIMMIAVGHLPESLVVAQSARKPIEEVYIQGRLRGEGSPTSGGGDE